MKNECINEKQNKQILKINKTLRDELV